MSERDSFVRALESNEDDEAVRLVFADWLDEQGLHEEAELQRDWRRAKQWLVDFCDEWNYEPDDGYGYYPDLSYPNLIAEAKGLLLSLASGGEWLYLGCGANESMMDALRDNREEFWKNVATVAGIVLPPDASESISFACSC